MTYKRARKIRERNKHATKGKIDHLKEAMTAKMVTMVMDQNRFEKMRQVVMLISCCIP